MCWGLQGIANGALSADSMLFAMGQGCANPCLTVPDTTCMAPLRSLRLGADILHHRSGHSTCVQPWCVLLALSSTSDVHSPLNVNGVIKGRAAHEQHDRSWKEAFHRCLCYVPVHWPRGARAAAKACVCPMGLVASILPHMRIVMIITCQQDNVTSPNQSPRLRRIALDFSSPQHSSPGAPIRAASLQAAQTPTPHAVGRSPTAHTDGHAGGCETAGSPQLLRSPSGQHRRTGSLLSMISSIR
jgi:hypothetical protein